MLVFRRMDKEHNPPFTLTLIQPRNTAYTFKVGNNILENPKALNVI